MSFKSPNVLIKMKILFMFWKISYIIHTQSQENINFLIPDYYTHSLYIYYSMFQVKMVKTSNGDSWKYIG